MIRRRSCSVAYGALQTIVQLLAGGPIQRSIVVHEPARTVPDLNEANVRHLLASDRGRRPTRACRRTPGARRSRRRRRRCDGNRRRPADPVPSRASTPTRTGDSGSPPQRTLDGSDGDRPLVRSASGWRSSGTATSAVDRTRSASAIEMHDQIDLFRRTGVGPTATSRTLIKTMAIQVAMIEYLDNDQNKKRRRRTRTSPAS